MATAALDLPVLTDGVVRLRPFDERDAAALAQIWRDPDIRARNDVPEPSEEAADAWVARSTARAAAGEAWEWAIVDAHTDELAGRQALKEIDWQCRRAVAAVWVGPRLRGRRFAARALRLAAGHAFAQGLARVHAECETDNDASVRSLVAAGMRYEGTRDLHVLGMLPEDLANAPALRSE